MSYVNRKNKFSVLLMASLIATNFAFAADSYKNNVVDVKVNKEPGNAVKVTIYTDKPYTDPVVVNKKANNKYVILMPETNSSLRGSPSVSEVAGTVSNVSVNTQNVSGGKGYTKIIITSEKAITVVPRTQQLSSSSANTKNVNVAQQEAQAKKAAELKAQQEKAKKLAQEKAQQEAQAKKAAELKAQQAKKLAQEKAKQEAQAKRAAELKAQQEKAKKLAQEKAMKAQQNAAPQQQVQHNSESYNHPIEVLEKEIETNKTANLSQDVSGDSFLQKEINDNLEKQKNGQQVDEDVKLSVISGIKAVLTDHENFSLWKLLLLASAITFPIIVIMLILGWDKKINKRIAQSFAKEEPQPMKSDINYIQNEIDNNPAVYTTIDNMLSQVEEQTPSFHEEQIMRQNLEQQVSEVQDTINGVKFENDFESDDFNNNSEVSNEAAFTEPEVPQNVINPTPEVVQETPVVADEVQPVEMAEVAPPQDYNPDGFLADFSNVDDKEFFDEIVIQSLAENNANGLPEQSPEDRIFDSMSLENELSAGIQNQNISQQNMSDLYSDRTLADVENAKYSVDMNDEFTPLDNVQESVDKQDYSTNVIQENTPEQDLVMLNQVEINDHSGLYLVDYGNYSSLVGYVDENYFVLKKFANHVTSNIILKPTEKLENSMRYLVRVGKDKMIVEVGNASMSRLLDL